MLRSGLKSPSWGAYILSKWLFLQKEIHWLLLIVWSDAEDISKPQIAIHINRNYFTSYTLITLLVVSFNALIFLIRIPRNRAHYNNSIRRKENHLLGRIVSIAQVCFNVVNILHSLTPMRHSSDAKLHALLGKWLQPSPDYCVNDIIHGHLFLDVVIWRWM